LEGSPTASWAPEDLGNGRCCSHCHQLQDKAARRYFAAEFFYHKYPSGISDTITGPSRRLCPSPMRYYDAPSRTGTLRRDRARLPSEPGCRPRILARYLRCATRSCRCRWPAAGSSNVTTPTRWWQRTVYWLVATGFGGPKRNQLFMTASQSVYMLQVNTQGAAPG
jgi:hypothetical protein